MNMKGLILAAFKYLFIMLFITSFFVTSTYAATDFFTDRAAKEKIKEDRKDEQQLKESKEASKRREELVKKDIYRDSYATIARVFAEGRALIADSKCLGPNSNLWPKNGRPISTDQNFWIRVEVGVCEKRKQQFGGITGDLNCVTCSGTFSNNATTYIAEEGEILNAKVHDGGFIVDISEQVITVTYPAINSSVTYSVIGYPGTLEQPPVLHISNSNLQSSVISSLTIMNEGGKKLDTNELILMVS